MTLRNDEGPSVAARGLPGQTQPFDKPELTAGLQALQGWGAMPGVDNLRGMPGVDNLRGMPAELRQHAAQVAIDARLQFGADPCTRSQAAAHEAGHVLVAYALGDQIESARIARRDEHGSTRWIGCAQYESAHGTRLVAAATNPELVLRSAALNLAGFAGEEFAGLSHRASSIDERYKASAYCAAVAEAHGFELDGVASAVHAYCLGVLKGNRTTFDAVRSHLYRMKRLSRSEAVRMLASVKQSAPAWLGGAQ